MIREDRRGEKRREGRAGKGRREEKKEERRGEERAKKEEMHSFNVSGLATLRMGEM